MNKGWLFKKDVPTYEQIVGGAEEEKIEIDDDEDEKTLEAQDKFEAEYNFRFEQP
jgi:hypothetical protein